MYSLADFLMARLEGGVAGSVQPTWISNLMLSVRCVERVVSHVLQDSRFSFQLGAGIFQSECFSIFLRQNLSAGVVEDGEAISLPVTSFFVRSLGRPIAVFHEGVAHIDRLIAAVVTLESQLKGFLAVCHLLPKS